MISINLSVEQLLILESLLKTKLSNTRGEEDVLQIYSKIYRDLLKIVQNNLYSIQREPLKKEYLKPSLESQKVIDTPKVKQHAFEAMLASLPL